MPRHSHSGRATERRHAAACPEQRKTRMRPTQSEGGGGSRGSGWWETNTSAPEGCQSCVQKKSRSAGATEGNARTAWPEITRVSIGVSQAAVTAAASVGFCVGRQQQVFPPEQRRQRQESAGRSEWERGGRAGVATGRRTTATEGSVSHSPCTRRTRRIRTRNPLPRGIITRPTLRLSLIEDR
jgi:hypothetical protein